MAIGAGGDDGMATSDVLAGSQWIVAEIDGTALTREPLVALEFGHDGRVSGTTGVNQFTASYEVIGESVMFGPLALTRRAGPAGSEVQEQQVVGSVAGICRFRLEPHALAFDGPLGLVRCWAPGRPDEELSTEEEEHQQARPAPGPRPRPEGR